MIVCRPVKGEGTRETGTGQRRERGKHTKETPMAPGGACFSPETLRARVAGGRRETRGAARATRARPNVIDGVDRSERRARRARSVPGKPRHAPASVKNPNASSRAENDRGGRRRRAVVAASATFATRVAGTMRDALGDGRRRTGVVTTAPCGRERALERRRRRSSRSVFSQTRSGFATKMRLGTSGKSRLGTVRLGSS